MGPGRPQGEVFSLNMCLSQIAVHIIPRILNYVSVKEHDVKTVLKTLAYDVMLSITGKLWRYLVSIDLQMEHMAKIYKPNYKLYSIHP